MEHFATNATASAWQEAGRAVRGVGSSRAPPVEHRITLIVQF
jgi:hypothetical protein